MLFDSFSRKELFHEFIHVFDPWESALIGLQLNNFCARYTAGKKHEACFPNFQSVIFFKNLRESDRINKCWKLRDFSDCCSTSYSRKGFNSKVFNESSLINFVVTERFRILLFKIVAITVAWKYGCIGEARNYWSVPCTYITWPVFFFFHFRLRRPHISFAGCIPPSEYFRPPLWMYANSWILFWTL